MHTEQFTSSFTTFIEQGATQWMASLG